MTDKQADVITKDMNNDTTTINIYHAYSVDTLTKAKAKIYADTETILDLGIVFRKKDNYECSEALLKLCLDKRTEALGKNHPDTLNAMHNLALTLLEDANFDAVDIFEQCFDLRMKTLGENHPDTLITMHCLGRTYRHFDHRKDPNFLKCLNNRGPERAARLLEKCLNMKTKVLGEDHPSTYQTKLFVEEIKSVEEIKNLAARAVKDRENRQIIFEQSR